MTKCLTVIFFYYICKRYALIGACTPYYIYMNIE